MEDLLDYLAEHLEELPGGPSTALVDSHFMLMSEDSSTSTPVLTLTAGGVLHEVRFDEDKQQYVLSSGALNDPGQEVVEARSRGTQVWVRGGEEAPWRQAEFLALSRTVMRWVVQSSDVGHTLCLSGMLQDEGLCRGIRARVEVGAGEGAGAGGKEVAKSPIQRAAAKPAVSTGKVVAVVVATLVLLALIGLAIYFGVIRPRSAARLKAQGVAAAAPPAAPEARAAVSVAAAAAPVAAAAAPVAPILEDFSVYDQGAFIEF